MDIDSLIRMLAPTSIVVAINEPSVVSKARELNSGIAVYAETDGDEERPPPADRLLIKHLGKVPAGRPKMHFQIDLLVLGPGTKPHTVDQLRAYCHPRGWIIHHDHRAEQYVPDPVWDVNIAKMRPSEKRFLFERVAGLATGSVYAEIGTYKGGSAMIAALANPQARIYAVDIWMDQNPVFEVFKRHIQFFKNIYPIEVSLDSLEEGPRLIAEREGLNLSDLKIDLLFVDGNHSYRGVLKDLSIYEPYARRVCGHDLNPGNEVDLAVEAYFAKGLSSLIRSRLPMRVARRLNRYLMQSVGRQGQDSTMWYYPMT